MNSKTERRITRAANIDIGTTDSDEKIARDDDNQQIWHYVCCIILLFFYIILSLFRVLYSVYIYRVS